MEFVAPAIALSAEIFGAYDIRGIVNQTLTDDVVYHLGLAIGSEARQRGEKQLCVARDGRLSGPRLSRRLVQGLLATGCDVIDIGDVPTPLLYFAAQTISHGSGIMLTGSHNPADYNGLKMVLGGETLAGKAIDDLHQRIIHQDYTSGHGAYSTYDIQSDYSDAIDEQIHCAKPLKVVVDAGNGIAGKIVPNLLRRLGCEVIEYYCEVDGNFPNHHPDPSDMANLQDAITAVQHHQADIGLAFDGDGDRLGVITNKGEVIMPDRLLMLLAKEVLANNPGATIVYDVKCSQQLETVIKQHGGNPLMWRTGHSFIKSKMKETGALLAGEMSGHIFYKDKWYGFDDAIYTSARLLEIIARDTRRSSELFAELPNSINTPEIKIAVPHSEKFAIVKKMAEQGEFHAARVITLDGVRAEYADGWGLIRASNTTPCLVMRFEATSAQALARIQDLFYRNLSCVAPSIECSNT